MSAVHPILEPWLGADRSGCMVLDGGLATELQTRGHDLNDALWSAKLLLDQPEAILAVHRDFLAAGADVATAASYQASVPGLRARGLSDDEARQVLRSSMELARRACDQAHARDPSTPRPLAVASLGAYGAILADGSEYRGDYAADDATIDRIHRERLEVLAPLADLVACETIPCLREAEVLARVLATCPTPAWVSFACRDHAHVGHGETIERCVAAVASVPSVIMVGVNCCAPAWVEPLVRRIASVTALPIVAYPNAGERYEHGGWCGDRIAPAELGRLAQRWLAAGARAIGGCCRTTPAHVAALHRLRQDRAASPHRA
ncbi:homocysteine S-methyltransferase [Paraliomyxa miuraensis]|uniref:homocysteine S-methyltransferase n=1 Tax=Paraliomyxa miuraensis TaxID=376150 RepID=UPI00224E9974|nr:homocysteine S-methyltransferase [Paraliomyxa miuraensis]MCX4243591.1 homocysteine S-methyltransferase [Paraliomyxa miuraensis]